MKRRFGPQHSGDKTIALTSRESGSVGGLPLCTPLAIDGAQVHCRGRFVRQHAAGILGHVCHNARTAAVAGNETRRVRTAAEDVAQTSDVVSRRRRLSLWAAAAGGACPWTGLLAERQRWRVGDLRRAGRGDVRQRVRARAACRAHTVLEEHHGGAAPARRLRRMHTITWPRYVDEVERKTLMGMRYPRTHSPCASARTHARTQACTET